MSISVPLLLITPGDPDGIGPEVTWKAIQKLWNENPQSLLVCVGASKPFKAINAPFCEISTHPNGEIQIPKLLPSIPTVLILPAPEDSEKNHLLAGYQAGWSIKKATQLVLSGQAHALVTGPISKDRLQKGGFNYPGHTEFLADLCQLNGQDRNKKVVTMMLANQILRVTLVTTHLGICDLASQLTEEKIKNTITQTAQGLKNLYGIIRPRIAVCALNPHAGENGLFGKEEINIIEPAIRKVMSSAKSEFEVVGPLPADTLFANHFLAASEERWDAVVCMYHDQGLIPVKLLDFHHTVNITLGLPIIRTSVDHGVGFDIAGKNRADPSSLIAAIQLATRFVQKQRGKSEN